jgi:hypothetical protein
MSGMAKVRKVDVGLYQTVDGRFTIERTDRFDDHAGSVEWVVHEIVNGLPEYCQHYNTLSDAKADLSEEVSA